MIDHVGFNVTDLATAKAFYEAALRPLGYVVEIEWEAHVGFGTGEGSPDFWISRRGEPTRTAHLAIRAPDRASVRAFHEDAVAAGGTDNGPPGERRHYHEHYYSAYVTDPDGNNVEAVCHEPEEGEAAEGS